jgi:CBS domain-containing protein
VDEVMTPQIVTGRERAGVAETVELMRAKGVRRVPVVDARGILAGIVAADDLVDPLAEEMSSIARVITREQTPRGGGS